MKLTIDTLIHQTELRIQHINDTLPEKERWGSGPYYRHELRMYERFLAELYALKKAQEGGGEIVD